MTIQNKKDKINKQITKQITSLRQLIKISEESCKRMKKLQAQQKSQVSKTPISDAASENYVTQGDLDAGMDKRMMVPLGVAQELEEKLQAMTTDKKRALMMLKWIAGFHQDGDAKAVVDGECIKQAKKLIAELEDK